VVQVLVKAINRVFYSQASTYSYTPPGSWSRGATKVKPFEGELELELEMESGRGKGGLRRCYIFAGRAERGRGGGRRC